MGLAFHNKRRAEEAKAKASTVKTEDQPKTKVKAVKNGNSKAESGILSTPTAEAKKA